VPLDKDEGVVKAQPSGPVVFHRLRVRVVEDRSSEALTVNQLSAMRSTFDRFANHRFGHILRP
jgi:hypothetical protein